MTLELPELCFAITDTVVIFDNLRGTLKVVAAVDVADEGGPSDDAWAPPTTTPARASTRCSSGWRARRRRCARSIRRPRPRCRRRAR